MYPHAKTEELLLGVRERSFAYTRKVVWANANGRKVTHHRLTGTSGTTQKYHIFQKSRHTYSEMKRKTIFRFAFLSFFRNFATN